MKKRPQLIRVSKTPPPGYPTEQEWKIIEKKLSASLPTKILPDNAGPVDRVKQDLCRHFVDYFNARKISQHEMAKILGVTDSRVSEILHYHHGRFTIDKLLVLLTKIKPAIKIRVA